MNFSKTIKKLGARGIVSRKPHPAVPFVLAFVSFIFGIIVKNIDVNEIFSNAFFILAIFTFAFAILHLIVVRILEK